VDEKFVFWVDERVGDFGEDLDAWLHLGEGGLEFYFEEERGLGDRQSDWYFILNHGVVLFENGRWLKLRTN
jgi:hypothetical protein